MSVKIRTTGLVSLETKYLPATNRRGSRVKASTYAKSATIAWDDLLDVNENHERAALALCEKLEWGGEFELTGGERVDGKGNVYVVTRTEVKKVGGRK